MGSRGLFPWVVLAVGVLALVAALGVHRPAWGQGDTVRLVQGNDRAELSVSGEAERWVDPDRCRVFLGCQSQNESLQTARAENNERVNRVIAAVEKLKIAGIKMKAPSLRIEILYGDTSRNELPKRVGYRVTQEFTVLLSSDDPKAMSEQGGQVVDAALEDGANVLGQIVFFKEDEDAVRREVLGEAVKDALAKGNEMAGAAGARLTRVWRLSGTPEFRSYPSHQNIMQVAMADSSEDAGTTLMYGQVRVNCSAQVVAQMD